MKIMKFCTLSMTTAFVLTGMVMGEEKGAAHNEKNRSELMQSEKLVESVGKAVIEQAELALSGGVTNSLDVLKTRLSVLEARLSVLSLNNFVDVYAPPQLKEKQRVLATAIKANLEAQIKICKVNYSNGLVGIEEMLFLELKLNQFLMDKHELMGLDKIVLERKVYELMGKLSKLGEEKRKGGLL